MFDPKSSKTFGYHIFLLPPEELFSEFSEIIKILAKEYQGPVFDPHLTLLSMIPDAPEVELVEKAKALALKIKPFEIELTTIETQDKFFRAFYLKAINTPEYQESHQTALNIFGMEKQVTTPIPHLSLYYGNIAESVKDEMKQKIILPKNMKFTVDKVYLYKTDGEAENWVRIDGYSLEK